MKCTQEGCEGTLRATKCFDHGQAKSAQYRCNECGAKKSFFGVLVDPLSKPEHLAFTGNSLSTEGVTVALVRGSYRIVLCATGAPLSDQEFSTQEIAVLALPSVLLAFLRDGGEIPRNS